MNIASYGEYALDLANTWDPSKPDPEQLPDVSAVRAFLAGKVRGAEGASERDLDVLREARSRIRDVMTGEDDQAAVDGLNALMQAHPVHPMVSGHDGRDWHLHLSDDPGLAPPLDDRPPGELLVASAVFGLAAWLLDVGMDRRGQCAEEHHGCWDVFVDASRNHSRRYCSTTCSNRANVAAHRARQRTR